MDPTPKEFARVAAESMEAKDRIADALQEEPHYEPMIHVFAGVSLAAQAAVRIRDQFTDYADMETWLKGQVTIALREADHAAALDGTSKH